MNTISIYSLRWLKIAHHPTSTLYSLRKIRTLRWEI